MYRVRNLLLCVVLLALAGILHHEWTQRSGTSGIEPEVQAAVLQNGSGQACNGSGLWHFVNNQTGGSCVSTIDATFICGGQLTSTTGSLIKCNSSNAQYNVFTNGNCSLVSASTGSQPGNLVLSNFSCTPGTPTPTPTPTPSPTPSGSPSP